MDTKTDSLALDYAKGMLSTIELDRALEQPFGTCSHEEHDFHADAYDYLEDVLDIQYLVSSDRQYLGARLLLSYGGPNTWLDTRSGNLSVYWGSDTATVNVPLSFTGALDEALAELWEMGN
jgi:hypothetical protein